MTKEQVQRANEQRIKRAFDNRIRVSLARKRRNLDASYVVEVRSGSGKQTTYKRVRVK